MLSYHIKQSVLYFEGNLLLHHINEINQDFPYGDDFHSIDVHKVEKVDTVGLAFLLEIYRYQQMKHVELYFLNPSAQFLTVLSMYDLMIKHDKLQNII